jgi:hypothetical protein
MNTKPIACDYGNSRGFLCHVCACVIDEDAITWAYWEGPGCDVPLCPEHKNYRDHTCGGMIEKKRLPQFP